MQNIASAVTKNLKTATTVFKYKCVQQISIFNTACVLLDIVTDTRMDFDKQNSFK